MDNTFKVQVLRCKDGDTFVGDITIPIESLELEIKMPNQVFRLNGCDTPERGEALYDEATTFSRRFLIGKQITVVVHEKDSFGRWLVDAYSDNGYCLNQELLKVKLAKTWVKGHKGVYVNS
jgi:endonuclease YncB( thermonuclease family)